MQLNKYFNIFPVEGKGDNPKAPAIVDRIKGSRFAWKRCQSEKLSDEYLQRFTTFGVVCGVDDLEVIDIDNHFGDASEMYQFISDNYDLSKFLVIGTGGGGYHIYYKCHAGIDGNKKLAQRRNDKGRSEALVETRGGGGYVVWYDNILNGSIDAVPEITGEQRGELMEVCKSLNEVDITAPSSGNVIDAGVDERPGDVYNASPGVWRDISNILQAAGWVQVTQKHWRRPGKKSGVSATMNHIPGKFYVFSSNADPFESETSYTPFAIYTLLECGGNYSQAAKQLAEKLDIKPKPKPQNKTVDGEKPKADNARAQGKWGVLMDILKDWEIEFRWNELQKVLYYSSGGSGKWRSDSDVLFGDLVMEMEVNRGIKSISKNKISEMVLNRTITSVYNPIDNFIKSIPEWDGRDRFAELKQYIVPDIDEDIDYIITMLYKHLIRAIKCATSDYVNRMVYVLHGPEEIGKSLFIKWLGNSEVYNDELIDPADKDSILTLGRYLIINMEELDGMNKREVAKLKAFISKGDITKRVAYGRHDEKWSRVASLFGSTNKSDILSSESNTRWLVFKVKNFDWRGYTKNIKDPMQLWAQANAALQKDANAGELTTMEREMRDSRNSKVFLETTVESELLMKHFEEGGDWKTATDVKLLIEQNMQTVKINFNQLIREMRRMYGEPVATTKDGKSGRYYNVSVSSTGLENSFTNYISAVSEADKVF